jgi:hypothetical protein
VKNPTNNYGAMHIGVPIAMSILGLALIIVGGLNGSDLVFGIGVGLIVSFYAMLFAGLAADELNYIVTAEVWAGPEPDLYRYEVDRYGETEHALVYAATADTDTVDAQTVHFSDHDGNTIAIFSHVSRVEGRKVKSEED